MKYKYPCYIYNNANPGEIQLCSSNVRWQVQRSRGWGMVTVKKVSSRLILLRERSGFTLEQACDYYAQRRLPHQPEIDLTRWTQIEEEFVHPRQLTRELLQALADTFFVPVEYFYRRRSKAPPLLFAPGERHRPRFRSILPAQPKPSVEKPVVTEDSVLTDPKRTTEASGSPEVFLQSSYIPPFVFHIRYRDADGEHRAHVCASSKRYALEALNQAFEVEKVLIVRRQPIQEGLILKTGVAVVEDRDPQLR